jgi:hypothetical protein
MRAYDSYDHADIITLTRDGFDALTQELADRTVGWGVRVGQW